MSILVKYKRWLYPSVLILATIGVYYPILGHDFLYYWDDQWQVMNFYTEGGFNRENLYYIFTEFYGGQYSPIDEVLYLLIYICFGYNPMVFHGVSLLLHALNACLIYWCFRRLFETVAAVKIPHVAEVSFLTALVFAVHPLNVESVAWISASKILVYAFFYLLATYSFLCYLNSKKTEFYILTLVLFVCSFMGKEQAVIFPVWLLLIYWIAGNDFKNKRVWIEVIPFFILALGFGLITIYSQGAGFLSSTFYPLWQRLVFMCYSLVEYCVKFAFPVKLSYLYPFPSLVGDPLPTWLLVYPLLIMVTLVSLWKYITANKIVVFGLLFFVIHLALMLHIIPFARFVIVADRYIYLPMAGLSFIVFYYVIKYWKKKSRETKKQWMFFIAACFIYLGVYSNIRSRVWHDSDTLKKELRELLQQRNDYEKEKKS
jgi:hypothetical protein